MRYGTFLAFATTMLLTSTLQAAPCELDPHDDFDFLVGSWVVRSVDGDLQGENTISFEEGSCLLVERWRGRQGGTGQSYNYVHPATKQWHQLWVSRGAVIDYAGGLNDAGAMHLEGYIHYQADGRKAKFAGTWTPRADGSVLQELKQFNDETQSWAEWFTGVYTRKP